jgi:hypothetical protein
MADSNGNNAAPISWTDDEMDVQEILDKYPEAADGMWSMSYEGHSAGTITRANGECTQVEGQGPPPGSEGPPQPGSCEPDPGHKCTFDKDLNSTSGQSDDFKLIIQSEHPSGGGNTGPTPNAPWGPPNNNGETPLTWDYIFDADDPIEVACDTKFDLEIKWKNAGTELFWNLEFKCGKCPELGEN